MGDFSIFYYDRRLFYADPIFILYVLDGGFFLGDFSAFYVSISMGLYAFFRDYG